jgi:hypothetical protein
MLIHLTFRKSLMRIWVSGSLTRPFVFSYAPFLILTSTRIFFVVSTRVPVLVLVNVHFNNSNNINTSVL